MFLEVVLVNVQILLQDLEPNSDDMLLPVTAGHPASSAHDPIDPTYLILYLNLDSLINATFEREYHHGARQTLQPCARSLRRASGTILKRRTEKDRAKHRRSFWIPGRRAQLNPARCEPWSQLRKPPSTCKFERGKTLFNPHGVVKVANVTKGETVIDLGSGGGIDVLLAAQKVGPDGNAIGVDMTKVLTHKSPQHLVLELTSKI